jgi:hypothetical protein
MKRDHANSDIQIVPFGIACADLLRIGVASDLTATFAAGADGRLAHELYRLVTDALAASP